jgi:Cys-tRNA(Pro) deacylase
MPDPTPPQTQPQTPVTRALDSLGAIPYRLFRHPGPIQSLEQAAQERGQGPEQVIRSIVFRLARPAGFSKPRRSDDDYVMVLIAGARQVSWPALRRHLGQSRLTMATEAELLKVTGYPVGAVSPFGLPRPMRLLVDESVFVPDEVSIGSGERGLTVILRSEDLRRALAGVEVGEFGE